MTLREQIRSFIAATFFVEDFADDEPFVKSGILDSLGMLELILFVESTFGLCLADSELVPENLACVNALVRFIERKTAAAA